MGTSGERSPVGGHAGAVALFFAATGGGVQAIQVTLATALAQRGFRVSCVMPQTRGPYLKQLPANVELVDLATRSPVTLVRRLAGFLRRRRPSLLLTAQHHTIVAAILARALARSDVPLVTVQHNTLSEVCRNSRYRLTPRRDHRRGIRRCGPGPCRYLGPAARPRDRPLQSGGAREPRHRGRSTCGACLA